MRASVSPIASLSDDSPSSTSGTDFVNTTRFEDVFCPAPSDAENFRFKTDLLGGFETKQDTDELSPCDLGRVGLAEDAGVWLFNRPCRS